MSSVDPITFAPSGREAIVSPWDIQTVLRSGIPLKRGESPFVFRTALPYSLARDGFTLPPYLYAMCPGTGHWHPLPNTGFLRV